jgi:uncharacterized membrane protein YhdT
MKKYFVSLLIFAILIIGLLIWGIYNFGHLPISKKYPTWGEFSSIITPFINIVGAFLLFFQIKNESDKNSKYFKLNNTDYNDLLNYILKEKK